MGPRIANSSVFFVDSSVLINHIRVPKPPTALDKAMAVYGTAVVSDVVVFELEVGARQAGRQLEFQTHFFHIQTYPVIQDVWIEAAKIQADLKRKNQGIGFPDVVIAATSIFHNIPLFTLNTKHFQRLSGLTLLPIP